MANYSKLIMVLSLWLNFTNSLFTMEQDESEIIQEKSCLTRAIGRAKMSTLCAFSAVQYALPAGLDKIRKADSLSSLLWGVLDLAKIPLKGLTVGMREVLLPWQQPKPSRNANFVCPLKKTDKCLINKETEDHVIATYQMMKDIKEAFLEANAEYFAVSGTLLGCVRNGGFIPWDDDLDLGVSSEYEELMPAVLCALHKKHYKAVETKGVLESFATGAKLFLQGNLHSAEVMSDVAGCLWKGWRIERWFDRPIVDGKETIPFCDIFLMKNVGNRFYYAKGFPHYSVQEDAVYPLQEAKFGRLTISVPNKPYIFLDAEYKDSWSDHIKKYNHCHGNNQVDLVRFTAKLEKMCHEDYRHAGPYAHSKKVD